MIKKTVAIIASAIILVAFILIPFGLINIWVFWTIAAVLFVFAFYIFPKIPQK